MTGRDIIIYILTNRLEDSEFDIEKAIKETFVDAYDLAYNFEVGVDTIHSWYKLGWIKGVKIGNEVIFPKNTKDPRKKNN